MKPTDEEKQAQAEARSRKDFLDTYERQLHAARRLVQLREAKDDLLRYTQLSMPDPQDPDNPEASRYQTHKIHRFLADELMAVERGETLRLIISVQPRVGKSELVSRRLPTWFCGRDPYRQVILAACTDDLALDFGRECREVMRSPFYQQVFPGVALRKGNASSERLQTNSGGILTFAGIGSTITGRGGDCLPAGTLIETDAGPMAIEKIVAAPYRKVLCYSHEDGQLEYRAIEGVASRQKAGLLRITSAAGRVVTATSDHRVFTGRGYVRADQLAPGDSLLCFLPERAGAPGVPTNQSGEPWANRHVLQQYLLGASAKLGEVWRTAVQRVQRACAKGERLRDAQTGLLQHQMPGFGAGGSQGRDTQTQSDSVPRMPRFVPKDQREEQILLERLRGDCAFRSNEREGQSTVFAWQWRAATTACRASVSGYAAFGAVGGWLRLCGVRQPQSLARSPYRPRSGQQPGQQSGDAVRGLPSGVASGGGFYTVADTVAVVERLHSDSCAVFDLQVERNHNFFANGVLVHNCVIVDDPIKSAEEARSKAKRDSTWTWFTQTLMSRVMGTMGAVVICATRWHEDDIIGRLTDPKNPFYNAEEAARWKVINIPAFAEENDPIGREPGEILWPERTPLAHLESMRRLDPAGFAALYMGRPAPLEGNHFKREHIRPYKAHELPRNLRYYAASDHAVSLEQKRDKTCFGVVGVDADENIWILPDLVWKQIDAEAQVEGMIDLMARYRPLFWWAEKGHISLSIGPFLRKRMLETKTFVSIDEKVPSKDKMTRSQAIHARMTMGKVRFPDFVPWYADAVDELLNFPNGRNDDFVDFVSYIGLGLDTVVRASSPLPIKNTPQTGSIPWILQSAERLRKQKAANENSRYLN